MDPRVGAESLECRDQLPLRRVAGQGDLVDRDVQLLSARRQALQVRVRGRIDPD